MVSVDAVLARDFQCDQGRFRMNTRGTITNWYSDGYVATSPQYARYAVFRVMKGADAYDIIIPKHFLTPVST